MRRDSAGSLRSSRIAESGLDDFALDAGLQVRARPGPVFALLAAARSFCWQTPCRC